MEKLAASVLVVNNNVWFTGGKVGLGELSGN